MPLEIKSAIDIPDSHIDLLSDPVCVVLVTIMPDGQPQASVVWCNYDCKTININTILGRLKEKNMRARPMATIIAVDPKNPYRYLEIRGAVEEITTQGAIEHRNQLGEKYLGISNYYGETGVAPDETPQNQKRVICKIKPIKIITVNH
ncbi:MAG: PPOX class F420-dependent oxidoreductase [Anaerolineaceae bacterium]|nr:PPOX class F420-dependent oxidoreductase [Anaerolineaceae bacterium]